MSPERIRYHFPTTLADEILSQHNSSEERRHKDSLFYAFAAGVLAERQVSGQAVASHPYEEEEIRVQFETWYNATPTMQYRQV